METAFEKFENTRNILSDNTVLDELAQCISLEFVEFLESMYSVHSEFLN